MKLPEHCRLPVKVLFEFKPWTNDLPDKVIERTNEEVTAKLVYPEEIVFRPSVPPTIEIPIAFSRTSSAASFAVSDTEFNRARLYVCLVEALRASAAANGVSNKLRETFVVGATCCEETGLVVPVIETYE